MKNEREIGEISKEGFFSFDHKKVAESRLKL